MQVLGGETQEFLVTLLPINKRFSCGDEAGDEAQGCGLYPMYRLDLTDIFNVFFSRNHGKKPKKVEGIIP
jgi:hypothetical protein